MIRISAGASLAILLSSPMLGQSPTNPPTFEVADVHVSPPGTRQDSGGFMPGGRVEVRGTTMLDLVSDAYGVESDKVVGGPAWLNTGRFDIIAKAPSAATPEETLQVMLKTLLADRFKLVAHEDKRDMPVFILTAKKGIKLPAAAKEGPPSTARGEGDPALNNHMKCISYTMAALAELLPRAAANFVKHPVVDETHLEGAYDFQLDWMGIGIYQKAKANPDGPPAVGVFDALEKIGLDLEAGTRPTPVVVVDSVNQTPTPNPDGVTAKIPAFPAEFDVAEVRPAKPLSLPAGQQLGPLGRPIFENGRVEILSATLNGLLTLAFNVNARMLVGAPKWMDEDRFDVIAKTEPTVPFDALRGMLKALLIERFKLATHNEDQPQPVYVLEAGKKPKLKESDGTARSDCKIVNTDRRYYVCANTTMAQFAERLPSVSAAYIHPPLLDFTGLKGAYDFQLYWTPKAALSSAAGKPADVASTPVDEVTVFEAVDKQLGLKLEEQKHPVPVVVIDKVERTPSEK
jgi:uncharacterized protein (TIGR03435 family)